ncbi:MAG: DUF2244 domain-containing protein [Variibacter sp.]|nr:DUF2244 domain-containing protein [Variibacter sp.]
MRNDNESAAEPTIFSAILTPHRSLGRRGFVALMTAIGLVSFVAGMLFLLMGAWPVFGFFGLDALLIYWAFRANYRAGAAREEVIVTPSQLTVRRTSAQGAVQEWTLNPLWVRLDRERDPEFGLSRLALVSAGRNLPIAGFLGPAEKESFAAALGAALAAAKRGITRTVLP